MKVDIVVLGGELSGQRLTRDVGHVVLGREPGRDGVELPGDDSVSRRHGELFLEGGRLAYRNLSPNGSFVNDKLVEQTTILSPRDRIRLGATTVLEVLFGAAGASTAPLRRPPATASGPLAKPAVRILLGVYLVGLILLGAYLALGSDATSDQGWEDARSDYASYASPTLSESEKTARLDRADALVRNLRVWETTSRKDEARVVCAELMALDADPASPIYRFGARCSGANRD
jgi:hypothetical protein